MEPRIIDVDITTTLIFSMLITSMQKLLAIFVYEVPMLYLIYVKKTEKVHVTGNRLSTE